MNTIYGQDGKVIGFRCYTCGEVKDRMWGTKCNKCRNDERENEALRNEIKRLRKTIKQTRVLSA